MAKILVADDRPLNRDYIVTLLRHFGHELMEASDGLEALQIAKAERLDLVIADLVMPNMDGGELVKRMHADPDLAAIPILFYSAAYSERQAREVAREVGAVGVIPKPSDPEIILAIVNNALGLPSSLFPETGPAPTADWSPASALIEMSLELATEISPGRRLQRLAHLARKLIGARYAFVGLLGEDGETVKAFLSSGIDRSDGLGTVANNMNFTLLPLGSVLSDMMRDPHPLRLSKAAASQLCGELNVGLDWSAVESVLVVPFTGPSSIRGWILLADKLGAGEFSEVDAWVVSTLASQGALAHERAEEHLQAENDLRKSKAMFEALFESAPDAMLASDNHGRIAYANTQCEKMFGYTRNELAGQPIEILMSERFRGSHSAHRNGYYLEPHMRPMGAGMDLHARRRDGTEFPVDIMLSPMDASNGMLVLSVVRDITVRKQNEQKILELNRQLQTRVDELQTANQSLETFSYSISHDLRTPLRAIDGFSRILAEDYSPDLDDEAQRLLNVISANCQKMGQLIEDLLAFSRVSRNEVLRSEIDMIELAQSVLDDFRALEPARQIEIKLQALPPALAERAMVRQVLVNLISNAWKFTKRAPRPLVEVGSYRNADSDVYFVRDNGAGFDPQFSQKFFGVFERLHRGDEFEGSGIGLAMVRRIVRRHGGEAWGTGKVGEGAKFCFTLAAAPVEQIDRPVLAGKDDTHGDY